MCSLHGCNRNQSSDCVENGIRSICVNFTEVKIKQLNVFTFKCVAVISRDPRGTCMDMILDVHTSAVLP